MSVDFFSPARFCNPPYRPKAVDWCAWLYYNISAPTLDRVDVSELSALFSTLNDSEKAKCMQNWFDQYVCGRWKDQEKERRGDNDEEDNETSDKKDSPQKCLRVSCAERVKFWLSEYVLVSFENWGTDALCALCRHIDCFENWAIWIKCVKQCFPDSFFHVLPDGWLYQSTRHLPNAEFALAHEWMWERVEERNQRILEHNETMQQILNFAPNPLCGQNPASHPSTDEDSK